MRHHSTYLDGGLVLGEWLVDLGGGLVFGEWLLDLGGGLVLEELLVDSRIQDP